MTGYDKIKKDLLELADKSGRPYKPTFSEYIHVCRMHNIIDHAIRITADNTFYIHPHGVDGVTLDVFITATEELKVTTAFS